MPKARKPKTAPAVQAQQPFISADPHAGTPESQLVIYNYLMGLTPEQLNVVRGVLKAMQNGGYKNGCHYLKAFFTTRPTPVQLA